MWNHPAFLGNAKTGGKLVGLLFNTKQMLVKNLFWSYQSI